MQMTAEWRKTDFRQQERWNKTQNMPMSEGLWGQFAKRRKVSAKLHTVHNASVCKQPPNADLYALILAFARVSASVISTNILNPTAS